MSFRGMVSDPPFFRGDQERNSPYSPETIVFQTPHFSGGIRSAMESRKMPSWVSDPPFFRGDQERITNTERGKLRFQTPHFSGGIRSRLRVAVLLRVRVSDPPFFRGDQELAVERKT